MQLARVFVAAFFAGHILTGCGRPKPPTINPERAEVTSVGPAGIELVLDLGVENPNRVDLSARSVTGRLLLDGRYDLGAVTVSRPFKLASGQRTHLAVPMALAWKDLAVFLTLAATSRNLPYDVDGSVNVGGDAFNADLPFHLSGVLTHEQLLKATVNSLPPLP